MVISARLSSRHAISKLDDSPQHQNISCNAKQFNVQPERLMFYKDVCTLYHSTLRCTIRHYAEPFHTTLHHLCVRCTIQHYAKPLHATLLCMYAVPFDITLSHFTQRYTVCMYAVPFDITLSHFTQRYTVCAYAVLLDITLSHLTQRYTVCVLYCK